MLTNKCFSNIRRERVDIYIVEKREGEERGLDTEDLTEFLKGDREKMCSCECKEFINKNSSCP